MSPGKQIAYKKIDDRLVEIHGWASDPFVVTEASSKDALHRIFSRRASFNPAVYNATPEEYVKRISLYAGARAMMGWAEIPDAYGVVAPVEPPVQQNDDAPVEDPPEQLSKILQAAFEASGTEPPQDVNDGLSDVAKSWLDKMLAEGS